MAVLAPVSRSVHLFLERHTTCSYMKNTYTVDTSTMGLSRKHPLETHNLCVLQGLKSAPTNRTSYKVGDGPTGR